MEFICTSDLKELFFNTSGKAKVAHYTKLSTLKFLIKQDDRKSYLRLNNVAYMNDPSEGTVFLKLLKQASPQLTELINDLYITENIGSR